MNSVMRELDYKKTISEIQKWINEYVISAKVNGVVVGISGGIDSAVTTSLCVNALGKKNVIGLGLPCSSIPQDLNHAKKLAKNLGIKFITLELNDKINISFVKIYINLTNNFPPEQLKNIPDIILYKGEP